MSSFEIPLRSDLKAYRFTTEIEGTIYLFRIRFNARMDRWIMDICTPAQEVLVAGIPLLTNLSLNYKYKDPRLPQGMFALLDETGQGRNATYENLGKDIKLFYIDKAGLTA